MRKHKADTGAAGLNGYWVLDKTRSDTPTHHLKALGLQELAWSAAEKLDVALEIHHVQGKEVTVNIISQLGEKPRTLTFGVEHRETDRDGNLIRMTAQQTGDSISTIVHWGPTTVVSEEKSLASPDVLISNLQLQVKGAPPTKTVRTFVRSTKPVET
jgi:hypothetical protein